MATAEELLASGGAIDESRVLVIDNDFRTIAIPEDFGVFGVESDDDMLRVYFRGPRFYCDIDLSTFSARVNIKNADGEVDLYEVDDLVADDNSVTFSWLVGRFAVKSKGAVTFALCFRELADDGTVLREFNTTTATGKILEGLEVSEQMNWNHPDILESILARLKIVEETGGGGSGKSAYDYAVEAGFVGTEEEFAELLLSDSIKQYGAKGDGKTDDTLAFQSALANERKVSVPGGTYVLSDTLVIRENCCLELSQDTILKFTQTSGNCIEMRGSAVLRGNHGILWAAYGLTGHVIDMDTLKDGTNPSIVPPYEKSCPQFKRQRFVYDVNIIKTNSKGFNRPEHSDTVTCNGTAIYMHGDGSNAINFLWGVVMSGIRVAGGFSYGIRAVNTGNGWNHDMRVEAVIEACEIGVALENCNGAFMNVVIQPCTTNNWPNTGTPYAKHGFYLKNSKYVDLMRSRVWDWHNRDPITTKWEPGGQYQHLALIGNCRGLLLDDFHCTETASYPIRELIYTDTPSNFDTMTILQEPGSKSFKDVDGVPYFNNGTANRKLMLATDKFTSEQMEFISPADGYYEYIPQFKNLMDGIGYTDGDYLGESGGVKDANEPTTLTDFIPVKTGAKIIRIGGNGIYVNPDYGCVIAFYDETKTLLGAYPFYKMNNGGGWGNTIEDEKAAIAWDTSTTTHGTKGVFMRVSVMGKGANLIVTVDEPLDYTAVWHGEPKRLDDSIKVKAENVIGMPTGGGGGVSSWNDLTDKPFYSERVEVLPETTVEIDPDIGVGIISGEFTMEVGKEYTIIYNGVEYVVSNGFELRDEFIIGNAGALAETFPITEEPFCLAYGNIMDDGTYAWAVAALDGSTSVTLSITLDNVTPIPQKFVTEAFPYWIVVSRFNGTGNDGFVYRTSATVAEVGAAIKSGRDVKMRLDCYQGTESEPIICVAQSFASLSGRFVTTDIAKWYLRFGLTEAITGSSNALFAIPQDDGTYMISESSALD